MRIQRKAPAKINLALDITGKRADGYHLVRMIMQTVSLYDLVTVEIFEEEKDAIDFTCNIPGIPSDETNLCVKAARLMQDRYQIRGRIVIDLIKNIPSAAGLAGGSSDAAAVLTCIRDIARPDVTDRELEEVSVKLGADVPYCIRKGTVLCEGIGEILTNLKNWPETELILIKPDIGISTPLSYKKFDEKEDVDRPDIDRLMTFLDRGDRVSFSKEMKNVLEDIAVDEYPLIYEIKEQLVRMGSFGALMSGSGSTVFGLFENGYNADAAAEKLREIYPDYQIFRVRTIDRETA